MFGKMWEETAASLVGGSVEFAPSGRFKPYDFISNGLKYEVKADRLAYKYGGNTMFVEYECSGQPSGISTTEADVWMYFMVKPSGEYSCYAIPVADLKEWCKGCPVKSGGDGWRSRGYIVPVRTPPLATAKASPVGSLPVPVDLRIRCPPSPLPEPHDPRTQGSRTPPPALLPAVLHG